MSISHSLHNALSGLTAASRAAEVVSSNLANAMTDGYGRRRLDISAQQVGGRGAGVQILGVSRLIDEGILADRRLADASLARDDKLASMLGRLESQIGGTGSASGLEARLIALEDALVSAAADPGSNVRLTALSDSLSDLTNGLNQASDDIQSLRQEADLDIATQVETLNRSLQQVEQLNADIFRARNIGTDPSALMDQRQVVVDTIASIVPVRQMHRDGDRIALMTTSGQTLIDGPAIEVGFERHAVITADMTFDSGALDGLTINGEPVAGGAVGRLSGGSLGAAFTMRDEILPDAQSGLDNIAVDLISRFEDPTVDATVTAGSPGLLTDAGAVLDPLDTDGIASRISVNTAIDPDAGGALWRLRDGVGAVAQGPVGNAAQLSAYIDGLSDVRADSSGTPRSAAGHFAALISDIGQERINAEDELGFSTARWEIVRQTELADGVDTDHEMQMLLRIEEAYSANAKVIETISNLMRTLMEL